MSLSILQTLNLRCKHCGKLNCRCDNYEPVKTLSEMAKEMIEAEEARAAQELVWKEEERERMKAADEHLRKLLGY